MLPPPRFLPNSTDRDADVSGLSETFGKTVDKFTDAAELTHSGIISAPFEAKNVLVWTTYYDKRAEKSAKTLKINALTSWNKTGQPSDATKASELNRGRQAGGAKTNARFPPPKNQKQRRPCQGTEICKSLPIGQRWPL